MAVSNISTEYDAVTNDAENIGSFFATVSGSVAEFEGASRYIRYWRSDNPAEIFTTEVQEGSGAYSIELSGLDANTEYSYQMTENGEIKTFTTEADEESTTEYETEEEGVLPLTKTTYKSLTSTYKFSIECEQELESEYLVVACYDQSDRVLAAAQIECDGDTSYSVSVKKNTNIKYAKVFLWSNNSSLKPLGVAELIEIN